MSSVFDFAAINRRLREISKRPDTATAAELAAIHCMTCEGAGWEMYSTGHMDPHFRQCAACGNPKGLPCP